MFNAIYEKLFCCEASVAASIEEDKNQEDTFEPCQSSKRLNNIP